MAKKKIVLTILSLLLILCMQVTTGYAMDGVSGDHLIKNVQLIKNDGKVFSSNEELSFNDSFRLKVLLKDITAHAGLSGERVQSDIKYSLITLSEYIAKADSNLSWDVFINEGKKLGTATCDNTTKEISFVFSKDINTEDTITSAYLEMDVKLDEDKCGDKQTVDVSVGGSSPIHKITITDNKPKPPVIEKIGKYNLDDKVFEWEVKIQKGTIQYAQGLKFTDTFSDNQEYVNNSFYINKQLIDNALIEVVGLTISYVTPLGDDKDYTIRYKTKMNTAALIDKDKVVNDKEVKVSNKAQLIDIENNNQVSYDTKELKQKTGINWIEKKAGDKRITENVVYVPWTIKVDTNGYAFKDIIVNDIIKQGKPINNSSILSIVEDSIKITGVGSPNVQDKVIDWSNISSSNNSSTVDKNNYWWKMNLNEVLGKDTLNGVYTIAYETKITDYADYMKYNQESIKNDVSIEFGCPEFDVFGPGGTLKYGSPSVSKEAEINEGTLKKDFVSYDKSNHQMTWKVTFNENKSTINNIVKIKDFIDTNDQHKVIGVSDFRVDESATDISALNCTINKSDKDCEIVFNDMNLISGKKVSFYVVSELTDSHFYENNNKETKEFKNSATLFLGTQEYSTVNATYKPEIKVLSKDAKGYDYKNQAIDWEIKVNHDGMELKNAIIEDGLVDGLSLIEDSLKLSNSDGDVTLSKDSGSPYYSYVDNNLKVYLGDITKTYTLTFQTKVDVVNGIFNNKSFSNYNGTISIDNNAILKKNTSNPTMVESSQDISNKVLEKNGVPDDKNQMISYRVVINQAMTPKNKTELNDILSPGLSLSLPSIHLFKANINQKGEFSKGTEIDADFDTTILGKDNSYNKPVGSTLLTLSISENNGEAYILEYNAYVKDFGLDNYTNDIQGEGIIPGETKTSTVINSNQLGVGGGAESVKSSMIVYTLVDSKDKTKVIPGAEFTLYYKGKVVGVAVTDKDGKVIFNGLDENVEYNLVQTKTIDGYIPEEAIDVKFTAPKKGYSNRKEVTVENVKRPFEINNADAAGDMLIDSEYGLYKISDNVDEVIDKGNLDAILVDKNLIEKQITDKNGNIVFSKDMSDGLYIIRQLSVPSDYILSTECLVVKVENGLVVNIYHLSDDEMKFNNVIINEKKVVDPIPNPEPTPNPDPKPTPDPKPNPIVPNPIIPDIKPEVKPDLPVLNPDNTNDIKKPTKTGDNFPIEIVTMFISSLCLIFVTFRKRLGK